MKRVLLDHCVPRQLRRALPGHEVITTYRMGWNRLRNGQLLAAAEEAGFDVFITADQSIRFQQHLHGRRIAIVELPTNDRAQVKRLARRVLTVLPSLAPGSFTIIEP